MPSALLDRFTVAILVTVVLATVAPAQGAFAAALSVATELCIGLLFFLHGAKLSREAIVAGVGHLRLHAFVLGATFGLFPLLGLVARPLLARALPPELATGVLFLCALPATVQSAIAFTSIARGNVPAAVCSSSASTLLGLVLTPLLALGLLHGQGGGLGGSSTTLTIDGHRALVLVFQLLVPFVVGHLCRGRLLGLLTRHGKILGWVDRSSILFVVYGAFSESVTDGLWHKVAPRWCSRRRPSPAAPSASPKKTRSPPSSAARRRAWPRASRWRVRSCPRPRWARWSSR
jgi:solute carrier family 10 (sodium/bile acid cotransporter), member 7